MLKCKFLTKSRILDFSKLASKSDLKPITLSFPRSFPTLSTQYPSETISLRTQNLNSRCFSSISKGSSNSMSSSRFSKNILSFSNSKVKSRANYSTDEGFFSSEAGKISIIVVGSAICFGIFAYQVHMYFFGPGSVYPKPVRKLLRKAGEAYLQSGPKQNLDLALKYYLEALDLLNSEISKNENSSSPNISSELTKDSVHVTGLLARISEVYIALGDYKDASSKLFQIVNLIFSPEELADHKIIASRLITSSNIKSKKQQQIQLESVMRGIGAMNRLAEVFERLGDESNNLRVIFDNQPAVINQYYEQAQYWYSLCLDIVVNAYASSFNPNKANPNNPQLPDFSPKSLPPFLSEYMVTSLFYNSSSFFTKIGKIDYAIPLLSRSLDMLTSQEDSKNEEKSCKACVVISNLVGAYLHKSPEIASQYVDMGIEKAKKFISNPDCSTSLVSLIYANGVLQEDKSNYVESRIEFRKALDLATSIEFKQGIQASSNAISNSLLQHP
ncbi:hypothetical protein AYI68_g3721 [Smittium mucronatum]|uniref:TPR repeat-containing protein n=1 Tax=Smittium mucronatum TaxID=133383 RepID=A0A1R0GZ35_9FUNG|nr:hypothetical protein AYI68_g3721 [Smittium mucronatum]